MKGTWKKDEKENETNGKGNQRNIRRTWRNRRKGGTLNKMNVKQRYDWWKWKEHGRKWKKTDRKIKTHERNVNRNEREMARTRKDVFLYLCIIYIYIFFFQYSHTYKLWPQWWPRSCIPNILSVRIWTWHGGTMKGYGYEQIMEGNEMHWNKVKQSERKIEERWKK